MDNKILAKNIVELVGGTENILSVKHCMTRLRLVLKDESIAKDEEVRALKGTLDLVKQGGQYQIVIGPHVPKVMAEVVSITGIGESEKVEDADATKEDLKNNSMFNRFFKAISGSIFPIIGVMGATGILKAFLILFTTAGWMSPDSGTYAILYSLSDAVLYFMPVILGFSASKNFGGSPYIGATLGAALIYPDIIALNAEGASIAFMGIPVTLVSYVSSVFPIILGAYVAAKLEKIAKKIIPDMLHLLFVPLAVLVVVTPLTFLVIGPIMTVLSNGLAAGTQSIYDFSPLVAGVVLGAFWQVIVIVGLHAAFIPILINNLAVMGQDPINAILGVTVFALVGATLGFALKVRDKEQKAFAYSTLITGVFGITEPIIYGIAIPHKKPFISAFIGGGIAGGMLGLSGAAMQGFGGTGIFQGLNMIHPEDPSNFIAWAVASVAAVVISAVACYIMMDKDAVTNKKTNL